MLLNIPPANIIWRILFRRHLGEVFSFKQRLNTAGRQSFIVIIHNVHTHAQTHTKKKMKSSFKFALTCHKENCKSRPFEKMLLVVIYN